MERGIKACCRSIESGAIGMTRNGTVDVMKRQQGRPARAQYRQATLVAEERGRNRLYTEIADQQSPEWNATSATSSLRAGSATHRAAGTTRAPPVTDAEVGGASRI
ncbi:MAG: DUF1318 domain-containing protein [Gammaproteobacteria bacterium]|nr:DUF1318 domain-containing protein [Gammaproteobacteria bacterium]